MIDHADPEHDQIAEPERQAGEKADLGDVDRVQSPARIDPVAHRAAGKDAGADIVPDRVAGEGRKRIDAVGDLGMADRAHREQIVEGQGEVAGRDEQSGEDDLVLDETSATITLPKTFGRKERVQIDRGEIEQLTVETIEHRSSKGGVSYTYAPTLWMRSSRDGQKLADWSDRERAEAFVDWLRQKLNLQGASSRTDDSVPQN